MGFLYLFIINHKDINMRITKHLEFELAHCVRNTYSDRCSHSFHGHSYKVEITLDGPIDNQAGMVLDFGYFNKTIKPFIDSFDHSVALCKTDKKEIRDFFKKNNKRWSIWPINLSAEWMAVAIGAYVQEILNHTNFHNGEMPVVDNVRVWETRTGSATATMEDIDEYWRREYFMDVRFSDGIIQDWPEDLKKILIRKDLVDYKPVPQQIEAPWYTLGMER